ncbi:MAG: CAP domain-containing protein [Tepidisphaeraceae bacterium]
MNIRKRPCSIELQSLEPRTQFAAVYPSAAEQYAVELLNRARANPTAEAQRLTGPDANGETYNGDLNEGLAAGTITADAKQPLAINPYLTDSARQHSAWMIANSTFDHYETDGATPGQRMASAGYSAANWGENIAINWSSSTLDAGTTVDKQQAGLFTDLSIDGRTHRTNMMDPTRNEIGVGIVTGPYNYPGYGSLNAMAATHDTATVGKTFLTGVAYTDTVSNDDFYTIGEGLGGIVITATRASDNAVFTTTTWDSGGYSLELPAGTYDVTGVGTSLGGTVRYSQVTVGSINVKEDFVAGENLSGGGSGTSLTSGVSVRSRALVIIGTVSDDVIGVFVDDSTNEYVAGLNGDVTRWPVADIDAVAVKAQDGNDRVVIGVGVLKSYVEGGYGKDTLIGGDGADTLYGNAGIDRIEGNAGDDLLVGENGNDLIYGGPGNDKIYGGYGNDTIDAGAGNDRLFGGPGNDILSGGRGRDYLVGSSGADTLDGGAHTDYGDNDPLDIRSSIEIFI